MSPGICQELKRIIMVFITFKKINKIKYTYSLQLFTFLFNSFQFFSFFLTILFNSFQFFCQFQRMVQKIEEYEKNCQN